MTDQRPLVDEPNQPIEIHVFEHGGSHYAFDVRNYALLRLSSDAAEVLRLMPSHSLSQILTLLSPNLDAPIVKAWYLHFLQMIHDGFFSIQPVCRPARPPFQRLVIMLAGGCNMGCTYCFERDVPIYQDINLLTPERAEEIVTWFINAHEGDKAYIQFYGGEPLLNFAVLQQVLERLEDWADGKGILLSKHIVTNGTLLNEERIQYLHSHGVGIQVSVDGDRQTHDRFRILKSGAPTLSRISPNILRLKELGATFNLRAVLTSRNPDPAAVTAGLRALGGEHVSFEVVASGDESIDLSPTEWDEFNRRYAAWLDEPLRTWNELPHEIQRTISRICERQHIFYGCGAGLSEVTVAPDGRIYECQRLYREPLSTIEAGKTVRELDSTFLTMVDDRPVCRDCWARYLCGGGCLHQSHVDHGTDEPLPAYCTMKRSMVEAAIVKIAELRTQVGKSPHSSNVTPT